MSYNYKKQELLLELTRSVYSTTEVHQIWYCKINRYSNMNSYQNENIFQRSTTVKEKKTKISALMQFIIINNPVLVSPVNNEILHLSSSPTINLCSVANVLLYISKLY